MPGGEGRGVQGQDWEGAGILPPAAVAKCHRLVAYSQQTFLTLLEAGSPKSGCQQIQRLVKACFLVCRQLPSWCVLTRLRAEKGWVSGVSSSKGTKPILRAPPSSSDALPKAPPPTSITLGVRISTCEFLGDKIMQSTPSSVDFRV